MNLKEEKEKAYKKACADSKEELEDFDFDMGFDAGVLAERERIRLILVHETDNDNEIFEGTIWDRCFPNEGEG